MRITSAQKKNWVATCFTCPTASLRTTTAHNSIPFSGESGDAYHGMGLDLGTMVRDEFVRKTEEEIDRF